MNGLFYGAGSPSWLTQTVVAVIAVLISGVITIILDLALTYTGCWNETCHQIQTLAVSVPVGGFGRRFAGDGAAE